MQNPTVSMSVVAQIVKHLKVIYIDEYIIVMGNSFE